MRKKSVPGIEEQGAQALRRKEIGGWSGVGNGEWWVLKFLRKSGLRWWTVLANVRMFAFMLSGMGSHWTDDTMFIIFFFFILEYS